MLPKAPAAGGGLAFLESELALVTECIQKNPKSYGAWHHRRWLFERAAAAGAGFGGAEGLALLLDRELLLCTKLLDADERNFHCWNYRRFIAGLHPTRTASVRGVTWRAFGGWFISSVRLRAKCGRHWHPHRIPTS